jgi:hypothetical protein
MTRRGHSSMKVSMERRERYYCSRDARCLLQPDPLRAHAASRVLRQLLPSTYRSAKQTPATGSGWCEDQKAIPIPHHSLSLGSKAGGTRRLRAPTRDLHPNSLRVHGDAPPDIRGNSTQSREEKEKASSHELCF